MQSMSAHSQKKSASSRIESNAWFPHDVVAVERADYFLTLAARVPADHHVDVRHAGNAFPLLPPELDPPVAELVRALAQEGHAAVAGHLLAHRAIQPFVPATEQLLILLSPRVPSGHDPSQDPRAD